MQEDSSPLQVKDPYWSVLCCRRLILQNWGAHAYNPRESKSRKKEISLCLATHKDRTKSSNKVFDAL